MKFVTQPGTTARWVLITSILASSMAFIDGTALSVALPALQTDLGATGSNLLWVTNGFSLPLAALLLFGGALGDSVGRKKVFVLGILLFTAASLACGLAPSINALLAARVVQGVGGALMIPGSLAMLSSFFAPEQRGKAIGAWSAFSVLATTLGPILGGILASAGYWRGVFFINLPLALFALFILGTKIPAEVKSAERTRVDLGGAIAITLGLAALNYGLIQWAKAAISDPTVWGALVIGVIGLVAFLVIQTRVEHPLLPLHLFHSRTLTGAAILSFLFYMGFHGTLFFVPLNLIQVQGYAPKLAGLTQVPIMVLLIALSGFAGRLVDRRGPRLALTVGPIVTGIGFFLLSIPGITAGPKDFVVAYLPGLLAIGVGLGFTAAPVSTTIMISISSERLGLASGINSTLTRLAGVFAIATLGPGMLAVFRHELLDKAAALTLPVEALAELKRQSVNLALTQVPAGLDAAAGLALQRAIQWSFVDAFRWVVIAAAVLCWAGAAVAFWLLPNRALTTKS